MVMFLIITMAMMKVIITGIVDNRIDSNIDNNN